MSKDKIEWVTLVAPEIIKLSDNQQVRVEVKQGGDKTGLSIRHWFRGENTSTGKMEWIPTKKGIWLPIDKRQELVQSLILVVQNYAVFLTGRL